MFHSKYVTDNYKIFKKMNIEAVNKIPETIRVIPDHLKTKKMCEHSVKKLHFLIRHVPDQLRLSKCVITLIENDRK